MFGNTVSLLEYQSNGNPQICNALAKCEAFELFKLNNCDRWCTAWCKQYVLKSPIICFMT